MPDRQRELEDSLSDQLLRTLEDELAEGLSAQEILPSEFLEVKYLRAFPDVAEAVRSGEYLSARQHYLRYGKQEERLARLDYLHCWPILEAETFPACGIDAVFGSPSGRHLVIGWINDEQPRLSSMSLLLHQTALGLTDGIARCRREDAEKAVGAAHGRLLGFWAIIEARPGVESPDMRIVLMTGTTQRSMPVTVQPVSDERLREVALEYFAHATYFGNPNVDCCDHLDTGLGDTLLAINTDISTRITSKAYCKRFGPARSLFQASIVVCLYGKMEFLFLQSAFFTTGQRWQEYEFIYVSNSPELAESLFKEAAIATQIYGINISLVILPGNAGFGAANNVAAEFAQSDRILITNPDVFPRADNWAVQHIDLLESLPADQTRMFGAPLYYDDGSLMHGGMFFAIDEGLSVRASGIEKRDLIRVEHYGKGAPPNTQAFLTSRPVPAVTGAFISVDRAWFEKLGGFSLDYVFGHYEDADLCLRSLSRGTPVWLHNIPFWHLEGKGSTRRVVHDGGSMVNRWHFSRLWRDLIGSELLGKAPARLARIAAGG